MHTNMNELIKIETRELAGAAVQTCNARDLHQYLGVGKVFAAWIQERIERYGFEQGKDYEVFSDSGNNPQGGRPTKEYAITIDTAKELAMVENNEKGRQVRRYFIECERRAKAASTMDPMTVLADPAAMRTLLLTYTEKVIALEEKVAEQTPKVDAFNRLSDADGTMNPTVAAKNLQVRPKKLFDWMREHRWIYRRPGSKGNVAYQDKIQCGYLTHKITSIQRDDGTEKIVEQVLITSKGLAKLSQSLVAA